jgi:carboxypeptidase Q
MRQYIYKLLAAISVAAIAQATYANPPSPTASEMAERDELAYQIIEDLTTQIGPRQGGTASEQRARDRAVTILTNMGFANVREETFMMPTWVRGKEEASVFGMELSVAALGNSASTGKKPLEGELVYFETFDDLVAAEPSAIKGKIVFVDHKMTATQDGSSYGYFGRARFQGPNVASKKGAIALLVRSAGTDDHDHPHAGNTSFEAGVKPIPAAAVSNKDVSKIYDARFGMFIVPVTLDKDVPIKHITKPLIVSLTLTPKNLGQQKSGNVIAEVTGSNPALPPVLVACHLDSWDLGTGAFDDAAGCGIITAAAKYIKEISRPKRTIRILWAGAEEVGIWGGKEYAVKHAQTPHALAMESDFGADRVWRVDFDLPDGAKPLQERITKRLSLLGIAPGKDKAGGGADIGPIIAKQGLGVIDLEQDGTRYFDIHHTKLDTIALIDKDQLRQNVAAWTTVLEEVANYEGELSLGVKP